jgi:hypothetical protein
VVPAQGIRSELHQGQWQQPLGSNPPGQSQLPFVACRASQTSLQKLGQQKNAKLKPLFFSRLPELIKRDQRKIPHIWVIFTQNRKSFTYQHLTKLY